MSTTSIDDAAHDLKQRLERPTNEWGWERLVAERNAEIERLRALLVSCRKAMEVSMTAGAPTDWRHMIAEINGALEQKEPDGK